METISLANKFTGDREQDEYLILGFLNKNSVELVDGIDPFKTLYLYLCSQIELLIVNSKSDTDMLTIEESKLVDDIEDVIEYLEYML